MEREEYSRLFFLSPPPERRGGYPRIMPPQDQFELYDLRVEVVCPPGERILCGARDGDYFTLQGEMMYLPPGQGISIYSLGT